MSEKEKWVKLFEQVIGRKPTSAEFMAGKAVNFDLKAIRQIAGQASEESSTTPVPETSVTPQVSESFHPALETPKEQTPVVESSVPQPSQQVSSAPLNSQQRKSMGKGKKILLGLMAIISLALAGGYYYMSSITGPKVAMEAFTKAMSRADYAKLAQLLSTKKDKWEVKEAKSFANYLESSDQDFTKALESVAESAGKEVYKDSNGNKLLGLVETGKRFGIFSEYQVVSYPLEISVKTNLDKVKIDQQEIPKMVEESLGSYHFAEKAFDVRGSSSVGDFSSQLILDLTRAKQNQLLISLESKLKTLEVNLPESLSPDGGVKVLVNDKEVSTRLVSELELVENQTIRVAAQFNYDGKTYTSDVKEVFVSPDSDEVFVSLTLPAEVDKAIQTVKKTKEDKEKQASLRWNIEKSAKLADFMVKWGDSMGQSGYQDISKSAFYPLYWQGQASGLMDVAYSDTGISQSEYTIVATYQYHRDDNFYHRYHFALRQDGTPVVFYSENAKRLGFGGNEFSYDISKETENADLKAGFAAIVAQ